MSTQARLRIHVRVAPRGGRDAVDGWAVDANGRSYLKVRVAAPPVDGVANAALERTIARALKGSGATVRIVSGHQGRLKQLEIDGITPADLHAVFGTPSGETATD